jgi:uncharacterized protein
MAAEHEHSGNGHDSPQGLRVVRTPADARRTPLRRRPLPHVTATAPPTASVRTRHAQESAHDDDLDDSRQPRQHCRPSERGRLVADVSTAGSIVAPCWPLTAFVAVNPLGGLTDLPFVDATRTVRGWYGARTHLPLEAYRGEHARGTVTDDDLDRAILRHHPMLGRRAPLDTAGGCVDCVELVRWDLVHGPVADPAPPRSASAVADALDEIVVRWCAAFVDEAHTPWQMPDREPGFYRSWLALAGGDRRLLAVIGRAARARLALLPDDPAELLDLVLGERGIADGRRIDALRTWILRTPGWAGFARWCDEWAPPDRAGVRLRLLDLAAVRAAVDHLAPEHLDLSGPGSSSGRVESVSLERRVDAAASAFGVAERRGEIAELFGAIGEDDRSAIWLAAHEGNLRDRLLARLAGVDTPGSTARPDAQLVFCIDVRSEGLRRQLEALGSYETFGFAGFLRCAGPLASARLAGRSGSVSRSRVAPSRDRRGRRRRRVVLSRRPARPPPACTMPSHAAKGGIASPFALAESAGWFTGHGGRRPHAGAPTDVDRHDVTTQRPWWKLLRCSSVARRR